MGNLKDNKHEIWAYLFSKLKINDVNNVEFASRQIRTLSQIFDFLVLFCREFNADSYETIFNNFGYVLAEI